jgi:hypothetical protein
MPLINPLSKDSSSDRIPPIPIGSEVAGMWSKSVSSDEWNQICLKTNKINLKAKSCNYCRICCMQQQFKKDPSLTLCLIFEGKNGLTMLRVVSNIREVFRKWKPLKRAGVES